MVLDALAMAKKESLSERTFSVLIGGNLHAGFDDIFASQILEATKKEINIDVKHSEAIGEMMAAVAKQKFDLAFLYLHFFRPEDKLAHHQRDREFAFTDNKAILHRIEQLQQEKVEISSTGFVLISFLSKMHGIPVVVLTGSGYQGVEKQVEQAGACSFFPIPFDNLQLVESLREIFLKQK